MEGRGGCTKKGVPDMIENSFSFMSRNEAAFSVAWRRIHSLLTILRQDQSLLYQTLRITPTYVGKSTSCLGCKRYREDYPYPRRKHKVDDPPPTIAISVWGYMKKILCLKRSLYSSYSACAENLDCLPSISKPFRLRHPLKYSLTT